MNRAERVLVTGANGFVGASLCARLTGSKFVRAAVRNLPAGSFQNNLQFVKCDLSPSFEWSELLDGITHVVHCAARVHVMSETIRNPLAEFRRVNVEGTMRLARQAAEAGVRRFIFLSSIKVNGEQTRLGSPFVADQQPNPVDHYGISKMEAEEGLLLLGKKTRMEIVIIRPPLIYGPGVKANFLAMMRWLKCGFPLPLGAVTENRRSLVALDNLVDLIVTCVAHPAAASQTFLVSDGESLSTAGLLFRMGEALGRPAWLMPVPVSFLQFGARVLGKSDVALRLCGSLEIDISKTRQLLGWEPPISVDEGLRRTVECSLMSNE